VKITVSTWSLQRTAQELALAERLGELGADVHTGVTSPQIRSDRFRAAIAKIGAMTIAGLGPNGKPITFGAAYAAIYGTEFVAPDHHDNGEGV
jgi:hypothetical protein